MAKTMVERYEQILAAEPGSMVFVELARARLDRGDAARALEVCDRGLAHHPRSVQGRVLKGRALLALGRTAEALEELGRVTALDPENPYAFNLVGQTLLEARLHSAALPVLRRAALLQPGDVGVRAWLEEAQREVNLAAAGPPAPPSSPRPPPLRRRPAPGDPVRRSPSPAGTGVASPPPGPPPLRPAEEPGEGAEAGRAADLVAAYEAELRSKLAADRTPPPAGPRSRRRTAAVLISLGLVALVAGWLSWRWVREDTRGEEIASGIARARAGIARDTPKALRASVRALDQVLARESGHGTARALRAQAAAILAVVYGEGDVEAARRFLADTDPAVEPGATLAARRILARDEAERREVDDAILAQPPGGDPGLDSLAGVVLLSRGQATPAIERFNAALAGGAGHVPTFVRVGDYYRSRGSHEDALRYYALALAVAEDHPGAVLGTAASRLATGADPDRLRATLKRLDGLAPAAAVPVADRSRLAVLRSRILSALDDRPGALAALEGAEEVVGDDREQRIALARALAEAGAPDRAEAVLRALPAGDDPDGQVREALARVLLALERYREVVELPAGPADRSLHLWKGVAWLRLGSPARARAELRATARPPENKLLADAVAYLALADLAAGDVGRARANLSNVGEGPRARPTGRWALGTALWEWGRLDEAREAFEAALAADPRHLEARCALGRLLLSRGEAGAAAEHLERAVAANPFHREAAVALGLARLAGGDLPAALAGLQSARDRASEDPAVAAALALAIARDGRLPEAEEILDPVSASRDPLVLRARGELALARGDAARAVSLLAEAARSRRDVAVLAALGEAHLSRGDGALALTAFERARRHGPEAAVARLGVARSRIALGRTTAAEKDLLALLAALPPDAPVELRAGAHAALAEAVIRKPRELERALGAAREAVRLDPHSAAAQLALGRVLAERGEDDEAASCFSRAAELAPNDASVHLARGRFLAGRRDGAGEARRAFDRARELAPGSPVARAAEQALRRLP